MQTSKPVITPLWKDWLSSSNVTWSPWKNKAFTYHASKLIGDYAAAAMVCCERRLLLQCQNPIFENQTWTRCGKCNSWVPGWEPSPGPYEFSAAVRQLSHMDRWRELGYKLCIYNGSHTDKVKRYIPRIFCICTRLDEMEFIFDEENFPASES